MTDFILLPTVYRTSETDVPSATVPASSKSGSASASGIVATYSPDVTIVSSSSNSRPPYSTGVIVGGVVGGAVAITVLALALFFVFRNGGKAKRPGRSSHHLPSYSSDGGHSELGRLAVAAPVKAHN